MLALVQIQRSRRRSIHVPVNPHVAPKRIQRALLHGSPIRPALDEHPNLARWESHPRANESVGASSADDRVALVGNFPAGCAPFERVEDEEAE